MNRAHYRTLAVVFAFFFAATLFAGAVVTIGWRNYVTDTACQVFLPFWLGLVALGAAVVLMRQWPGARQSWVQLSVLGFAAVGLMAIVLGGAFLTISWQHALAPGIVFVPVLLGVVVFGASGSAIRRWSIPRRIFVRFALLGCSTGLLATLAGTPARVAEAVAGLDCVVLSNVTSCTLVEKRAPLRAMRGYFAAKHCRWGGEGSGRACVEAADDGSMSVPEICDSARANHSRAEYPLALCPPPANDQYAGEIVF